MDYKRLSIHHVGGRFGNGGFPVIKAFEKDIVKVFYDADSDCIEQIKEKIRTCLFELHVLPYCIGEANKVGLFNINYDPTSSSVYSFNPDYDSFYFFCYNHDFIVSENMKLMERREVEVVTIDHLFKTKSVQVAPPDFLSMDVQGSEYNILQGAKDTIKQHVLGLAIETWFHPVYSGQKIFGDINQFLSDMGFHFVKFLKFTEYSPSRAPVGLRGEGFQVFADALFIRRIGSIEDVVKDERLLQTMLKKLAFISIIYDQFEYGLECLRRSKKIGVPHDEDIKDISFYKFLNDVEKSIEKMPVRYPKTFAEKYTFELSKERFESLQSLKDKEKSGNFRDKKRTLKEKIWLKFIYPKIYSIAEIYDFLLRGVWANITSLIFPNTSVEKVLIKYGLKTQARLLKKNRVVQSFFSHGRKN